MRSRFVAVLLTTALTLVAAPATAASAVPGEQTLACAMPFLSTGFGPVAQCTQLSTSGTTGRVGLYSPITGQFQSQTDWLTVVEVKWFTDRWGQPGGGPLNPAVGYVSLATPYGPAVWATQYRSGNTEGRWGSINLITGLFYPAGSGAWSSTSAMASGGTMPPMGGIAIRQSAGAASSTLGNFVSLQMNLCNGGGASCYRDGAAVPRARQVILDHSPTLVTLNEICESDVPNRLLPAMLDSYLNEWVFWSFMPAGDRSRGNEKRCTLDSANQIRGRYGNGLLGRLYTAAGPYFKYSGLMYPDDVNAPDELQDKAADELRSWLCVDANHQYLGCTSHLDNDNGTGDGTILEDRVAFNQCKYLTMSVLPLIHAVDGYHPTVLGGDLNLVFAPGAKYSVQGCVPSGWFRKGDGHLQHTMATNDFGFVGAQQVSMEGTSDHPAWKVVLNR